MKLEVKYLFPISFSGATFFIYELPEGLGMRKILANGTRMQKNPQNKEEIFWICTDFHSYAGPKSSLHPLTEISSMASIILKSSIQIAFL